MEEEEKKKEEANIGNQRYAEQAQTVRQPENTLSHLSLNYMVSRIAAATLRCRNGLAGATIGACGTDEWVHRVPGEGAFFITLCSPSLSFPLLAGPIKALALVCHSSALEQLKRYHFSCFFFVVLVSIHAYTEFTSLQQSLGLFVKILLVAAIIFSNKFVLYFFLLPPLYFTN